MSSPLTIPEAAAKYGIPEKRLAGLKDKLLSLYAERSELAKRITETEQQLFAVNALAKAGEVIEWKYGNGTARGRIESLKAWCNETAYVVRRIKKDGTEGSLESVYPYHDPRRAAV